MAARRRRAAAELGSDEYRAACEEIAAIEVRIAEIEQPARAASS
jgi:transcription elongation GreA/GreB family factor